MNNKYIKLLIASIILLVGINVYAEKTTKNYTALIEDDAQPLTETQKIQLREQMAELTEYGNIAFKSININLNSNIENYAQNYYDCAKNANIQIEQILKGEKNTRPMRYISNFIIAIAISLFINFLIVLAITKKKKTSDKKILDNCDIHFEISNIKSKKNGTRKTFIPKNYG